MSRNDERATELERLVGLALRELPSCAAPASLESRVFERLERRARRAWWYRGFAAWPLALRALFVMGASAAAAGLLWAIARIPPHSMPGQALARANALLGLPRGAGHVFISLGELSVQLLGAIPRDWLYGGLLAAVALYAVFFALLAVAYRALYAHSQPTQAGGT